MCVQIPALFSLARDSVLELTLMGSVGAEAGGAGEACTTIAPLARLEAITARLALHSLRGDLAVFHPAHLADFTRQITSLTQIILSSCLLACLALLLPS